MINKFYSKVFLWLFIGLLLTFGSGYLTTLSPIMFNFLFNGYGSIIIFILQIVLCIFLSARVRDMNPVAAKVCYLLYALLTGITFSTIFIMFKVPSIIFIFLVTSILLGVFALLGYKTKVDLTKISTYLFIGLIGIVLLELINIFIMSGTLNIILCFLSITVFLGYIAFDMQRIKEYAEKGAGDNYAILGAFELYLDFINIFLDLLRLFGDNN